MNTYLGACRDFGPQDLDLQKLAESRMLYLTGYLWDTAGQDAAARKAAESGKALVAFDLADSFAVRRSGDAFRSWIPGHVDVLFGNRDEIGILTGASCDEDCVVEAQKYAPLIVMKIGEKGCLLGQEGKLRAGPRCPGENGRHHGSRRRLCGGLSVRDAAGCRASRVRSPCQRHCLPHCGSRRMQLLLRGASATGC